MTPTIAPVRAIGALSAGLVALGMLSACTSEPMPTPTRTTLFSSDEEAFKAAEETYSEYLTALNATDLTEAETFEPVYAWLMGTALAAEKESLSEYHAADLQRRGETTFNTFTPLSYSNGVVVANLCLDVSNVDLVDATGESVLPEDRLLRRALKVSFQPSATDTRLRIASNHAPESFSC